MIARIRILLKPGILDPQGKAIANSLADLGFTGVESVRQGKIIEVNLDQSDPVAARQSIEDMCEKLLANPVMEEYQIEIDLSQKYQKISKETMSKKNK